MANALCLLKSILTQDQKFCQLKITLFILFGILDLECNIIFRKTTKEIVARLRLQ